MPLWTEKLILRMLCLVKVRYRRVVSLVWNPVKLKLRSMEIRKIVIRVGKSVVKMTIDLIQTKRRDPNYTDSEKHQDASIFSWIAYGGSWTGTLKSFSCLFLINRHLYIYRCRQICLGSKNPIILMSDQIILVLLVYCCMWELVYNYTDFWHRTRPVSFCFMIKNFALVFRHLWNNSLFFEVMPVYYGSYLFSWVISFNETS